MFMDSHGNSKPPPVYEIGIPAKCKPPELLYAFSRHYMLSILLEVAFPFLVCVCGGGGLWWSLQKGFTIFDIVQVQCSISLVANRFYTE